MRQGTTPQITYTIPFAPSNITLLSIVIMQDGKVIAERDLAHTTIGTSANTLTISLTEEETLELKSLSSVKMQIRCGIGTQRLASNIMVTSAESLLKGGVLV